MELSKIKSYVGFAIKARRVVIGVDNITSAGKHCAKVILLSPDISERSRKHIMFFAERENVDTYDLDIETILPARNCKAIGITDESLAKAIKTELKEN